ncbi:hypothetical protein PYCCODRAFT_1464963 [Trametes coccinea BRFM310]|uniref:Uncharacterized protein n=1 Tax=Trametes coccinea (strain BRFM310) TaxID=1353009 RepID=A0A1Y2IWU0_TRAC3|nr:hypothetical protein PYCCODRAFT_1464963 [Trametes coccinea BRFM310]
MESAICLLEKIQLTQRIEDDIQQFADDIPWLLQSLDELARIHPAVTVAVLAFKAAYTLEITRRENDRRIMALYVEMKDLMKIIVQLRTVENHAHVGSDGRVLKDRLEELAERTAQDIKECANFCDTFLKKRLLVKVLKGPVWAQKLGAFVRVLENRKSEFQFALTMHTTNLASDIRKQTREIEAKVDLIVSLVNRLLPDEERRIAEEVAAHGGVAGVSRNDDYLKSLLALDIAMQQASEEQDLASSSLSREATAGPQHRTALRRRDSMRSRGLDLILRHKSSITEASITLEAFKLELQEDIDDALKQNLHSFLDKFEHQITTVQIALERYIREENDRIIGAVTDVVTYGPHLKVNDPELREVWQNMNWRANVQVELLIMTIRDHYREIIDKARLVSGDAKSSLVKEDWTLRYLSRAWLDPLSEAFDLDASGYVTILEVNHLMQLRPSELNWSVPRWLAYWAVGWGLGADLYCSRIKKILQSIRNTLPVVLPLNQAGAACYLANSWEPLLQLALGVHTNEQPLSVHLQFLDYVMLEERRLGSTLAEKKYCINTSDTLRTILGPGRLEKSILPLVVLLLQNDYRKFKAATRVVLAESEWEHSRVTMSVVCEAIRARYDELKDLCHSQKLNVNNRFQEHAWGLFYYIHDAQRLWSADYIRQGKFLESVPDYDDGASASSNASAFNEDNSAIPMPHVSIRDVVPPNEGIIPQPLDPLERILGVWHGFVYDSVSYPVGFMLSLLFRRGDRGTGRDFVASGHSFDGTWYEVVGRCELPKSGDMVVKFTIRPKGKVPTEYTGHLEDEFTIVGDRAFLRGLRHRDKFVLKRTSAEHMCLRPDPLVLASETQQGRLRATWRYAIMAVINDIRRRNWTWSYFAERRDTRKHFVKVISESLNDVDNEPLSKVHRSCTTADARFYFELARRAHRLIPIHYKQLCDASHCGRPITGARIVCLDCSGFTDNGFSCVSYCDKPCCYDAPPQSRKSLGKSAVHGHTHNLLKVRTVIHSLELPSVFEAAASRLESVRQIHLTRLRPSGEGYTGKMRHGELASDLVQGDSDSTTDNDAISIAQTGNASGPHGGLDRDADPQSEEELASSLSVNTTPGAASCPNGLAQSLPPSHHTLPIHANGELDRTAGLELSDIADGNQHAEENQPCWDCTICSKRVGHRSGWFCMEPQCLAFVCDKCEEEQLISCHSCEKLFSQPEWYWGSKLSYFTCAKCFATCRKAGEATESAFKELPVHVATHRLIRCNTLGEDSSEGRDLEIGEEDITGGEPPYKGEIALLGAKLDQLQSTMAQLALAQTHQHQQLATILEALTNQPDRAVAA